MPNAVRYLVDVKGNKTSVLVPVKIWETLNNDYRKLQNKIRILTGLTSALKEVDQAKKTGKKLQTLNDFLK